MAAHGSVYVVARDDDRILTFSARLKYVGVLAHHGKAPGGIIYPTGVAVDPRGDIYVADSGNNRIERFTSSGALNAIWMP